MRLFAAAICAFAFNAFATTFSTDASDIWWNANESGWGFNIVQQNSVIFATMFVYGPSGANTWYVAPDMEFTGNSGGVLTYSGALYTTTGPYFGTGTFNPTSVSARQVGTATLSLQTVTTGTLSYSVDGVQVSKNITRQTWRNNDISGSYLGATVGTYSGNCLAPYTGYTEDAGTISISQTTTSATVQTVGQAATCTFSGPYTQAGRMGAISGNYSCSNGLAGTFNAFEIEASISAVTARVLLQNGGCSWSGRIGGLRRGQ